MSMLNKKATDLGCYEQGSFGEVGPMGEHDRNNWYSDDCWSNESGKQEFISGPAGYSGDPTAHTPRNEVMYNTGTQDTPLDKLDQHKQNVLPQEGVKVFQTDDIQDVVKHMPQFDFLFAKKAYIQKEPGKDIWNVYSEKGKSLGKGYKSEKAAKERLKQVEMFKHMNKHAAEDGTDKLEEDSYFVDFRVGNGSVDIEPKDMAWNNALVAPQNNSTDQVNPVRGPLIPNVKTAPTNTPGMSQSDAAVADTTKDPLHEEASVMGDVKGKGVTPKIVQPVSNDVKTGSNGFSVSRGGRGGRGSRGARAELSGFVFTKRAATPASTVDTFTGSARRNDQSPWMNEGTNLTSYTEEQKKQIQKLPDFKFGAPLTTAVPQAFEDRLYACDTTNMANGQEFGTWDFFILPTNQKLDKDMNAVEQAETRNDNKLDNETPSKTNK